MDFETEANVIYDYIVEGVSTTELQERGLDISEWALISEKYNINYPDKGNGSRRGYSTGFHCGRYSNGYTNTAGETYEVTYDVICDYMEEQQEDPDLTLEDFLDDYFAEDESDDYDEFDDSDEYGSSHPFSQQLQPFSQQPQSFSHQPYFQQQVQSSYYQQPDAVPQMSAGLCRVQVIIHYVGTIEYHSQMFSGSVQFSSADPSSNMPVICRMLKWEDAVFTFVQKSDFNVLYTHKTDRWKSHPDVIYSFRPTSNMAQIEFEIDGYGQMLTFLNCVGVDLYDVRQ